MAPILTELGGMASNFLPVPQHPYSASLALQFMDIVVEMLAYASLFIQMRNMHSIELKDLKTICWWQGEMINPINCRMSHQMLKKALLNQDAVSRSAQPWRRCWTRATACVLSWRTYRRCQAASFHL